MRDQEKLELWASIGRGLANLAILCIILLAFKVYLEVAFASKAIEEGRLEHAGKIYTVTPEKAEGD